MSDWGKLEDAARKCDIEAVKAGVMTLEEAQRSARRRARQAGLTPRQAFDELCNAQRQSRLAKGQ